MDLVTVSTEEYDVKIFYLQDRPKNSHKTMGKVNIKANVNLYSALS